MFVPQLLKMGKNFLTSYLPFRTTKLFHFGSTIKGKDLSVCHRYNNILATRHVYKNIIVHVLYTAKISFI